MKRILCLLAVMMMLFGAACADTKADDGYPFSIFYGDESVNKIAITMDDCFELDKLEATVDLCIKYGVKMTVFPLGEKILPEDRELWQKIVDAGFEIGSHSMGHGYFYNMDNRTIISSLCRTQEALDKTLGYHYEIRWVRPPFGKLKNPDNGESSARVISAMRKAGYNHALLWNVSQAADEEKCVRQTKNGCIMLFHARNKDVKTLEYVIPRLLEKGFEMVTVSELLGFDPPEISEELYVYDWNDYKD